MDKRAKHFQTGMKQLLQAANNMAASGNDKSARLLLSVHSNLQFGPAYRPQLIGAVEDFMNSTVEEKDGSTRS